MNAEDNLYLEIIDLYFNIVVILFKYYYIKTLIMHKPYSYKGAVQKIICE